MQSLMKQFWKYVSLNIIGMIGISCYILADTFFVANGVGSMGLAALNIALPAYSLLSGVGQMLALGASTKYTILKAQGEHHLADQIFTDNVKFTLLIGILFSLAALFFCEPIGRMLGANDEVLEMTATYIQTMMVFSPFFAINFLMTSFVRNDGAPGLAMAAMVAGSLFNVIFDYIFVYPMGLGLWGAALATGFSPIVGLLVNSIHLIRKKNHFHFIRGFRTPIRISSFITSCQLGVSSLIVEISNGVVLLVFNMLILSISGNVGVAAYGVVANVAIVVIAVFSGITMGLQPLISNCYGKGEKANAHQLVHSGILLSALLAIGVTLLAFFAADPIVALFNGEENAKLAAIATHGIRIYFTGFLFAGINLILGAAFAAMEDAGKALLVSISRGLVLILPIAVISGKLFGLNGVWISFLVTEVLTACISISFWIKERKSQKQDPSGMSAV